MSGVEEQRGSPRLHVMEQSTADGAKRHHQVKSGCCLVLLLLEDQYTETSVGVGLGYIHTRSNQSVTDHSEFLLSRPT